jgi:ribonuclease VapC
MIVDTSAIMTILLGEEGYQRYLYAIRDALRPAMLAVSVYETGVVLMMKRGAETISALHALLVELGITIEEFNNADAAASLDVYKRFGKGRHSAKLNFGDCPVYVLAKSRETPILHTGNDFSQTDIRSALPH